MLIFEIGGHSLRAIKVVNRIEAETGVRIPIKDNFCRENSRIYSKVYRRS
ncbi:phosphopantetheine-binding protein [Clostridium sp. MB40-C1]|nr:phosphopantetheine-binding protein [Clostridium sp. MB40-C1]WMJ80675.1 phosphopantetheine-binding protein [Clostridium sp. MB40-C1]